MESTRALTDLPAVSAPSLVDAVYDGLTSAIVRGELVPGQHLSELELCRQLGVSRSPLREAFHRLVAQGMLERLKNRGVRVAPIDAQRAKDFYECRVLIEPHCAMLASPFIDDGVISRAEAAFDQMRAAYGRLDFWEGLITVERFHDTYRTVCPNRELVHMVSRFAARSLQFRAVGIRRPNRPQVSLEWHEQILAGMRSGDDFSPLVEGLLRTSMEGVIQSLSATD